MRTVVRCTVGVVMLALAPACSKPAAPQATPSPAVSVAPASATETESATAPKAAAASPTPRSAWADGAPVIAHGKISDTPHQHLVGAVPGKQAHYFDLDDDVGEQIVIYSTTKPECAGRVEVEGRVKEVRGRSKRPGSAQDSYAERHIDVSSHRCLP